MPREANIPLFLWVAMAVLVHLVSGEGADEVGQLVQEKLDVKNFAASVRRHVQLVSGGLEVDLVLEEDPQLELPNDSDEGEYGETAEQQPEPDQALDPSDDPELAPEQEPLETQPQDEEAAKQRAELEKQKKEEQEKEKEKEEAKKPEVEVPVLKDPDFEIPKRVSIKQVVKNPSDDPNSDARFIADEANRVKEETQARITALDQDNAEPSMGDNYAGPTDDPGNAHVTDIGHASDSPGDDRTAPSEKQVGSEASATSGPEQALARGGREVLRAEQARVEPRASGQSAEQAATARLSAPDLFRTPSGVETAPDAHEARAKRDGQRARRSRLPALKPNRGSMLGLGGNTLSPGGVQLNLSHGQAFAAIGKDQLQREIESNGERRLSKHRGRWQNMGLERWRPAIENYVAGVKVGNQTSLNAAQVPFASYLHSIHSRLHPIFAHDFLAFLDTLPREHPMNDLSMHTNVEIVLSGEDGRLTRMGVTRSSGSTAFDIGALEAVQLASPFGAPPPMIISPDGNVYLHWEFYRDRIYACSTYFARPFILKPEPGPAPAPDIPKPLPPSTPPEHKTGSVPRWKQPTASTERAALD